MHARLVSALPLILEKADLTATIAPLPALPMKPSGPLPPPALGAHAQTALVNRLQRLQRCAKDAFSLIESSQSIVPIVTTWTRLNAPDLYLSTCRQLVQWHQCLRLAEWRVEEHKSGSGGPAPDPWRIAVLWHLAAWWWRQGWTPTITQERLFARVAACLLDTKKVGEDELKRAIEAGHQFQRLDEDWLDIPRH